MKNFEARDLPVEGTKQAREVLHMIDLYQEKTRYTGGIIHLWPRHWNALNNALKRSSTKGELTRGVPRTLHKYTYRNFILIENGEPMRNF